MKNVNMFLAIVFALMACDGGPSFKPVPDSGTGAESDSERIGRQREIL